MTRPANFVQCNVDWSIVSFHILINDDDDAYGHLWCRLS